MPTQETIIALMDRFIGESAKEGILKKIEISENLIALLYVYLRELGVSDDEITAYYKSYESQAS